MKGQSELWADFRQAHGKVTALGLNEPRRYEERESRKESDCCAAVIHMVYDPGMNPTGRRVALAFYYNNGLWFASSENYEPNGGQTAEQVFVQLSGCASLEDFLKEAKGPLAGDGMRILRLVKDIRELTLAHLVERIQHYVSIPLSSSAAQQAFQHHQGY